MKEYLIKGLEKYGIVLEEKIIEKLIFYKDFLQEKNKTVNLTAITDDKSIIEKHFIDSLIMSKYLVGKTGKAIDIGTGAGFPGMVLAIANSGINFTLVDSVGKKTKFLDEVKNELNLSNVEVVNKRSEDYINEGQRETFDFAFARGVSELRVTLEYVTPFLKTGGIYFAQKMNYEEELKNAENALSILKARVNNISDLNLPYSGDRRIILEIYKYESCSVQYPRKSGKAEKKPL